MTQHLPISLPDAMLAYRCNLQGCCCSQWHIHFTADDLLRLADHLPEEEVKAALGQGLICSIDREQTERSTFRLELRGDRQLCRFLGSDRSCSLQDRHGIDALPAICAEFPVVAWQLGERIELGYSTLCPAVLDALFASTGPLKLAELGEPDPMTRRRLERAQPAGRLTLAGLELSPAEVTELRRRAFEAAGDMTHSALEHLQAVSYGLSFVVHTLDPAAFELRHDMPALPFVRYFHHALQSHGSSWLVQAAQRYRRFVFDPELLGLLERPAELEQALEHWPEPLQRWVEPEEGGLRPYLNRFLAHRWFAVPARFEGEVLLGFSRVGQLLATGLRFAAAYCALLQRPLDLPLLKVALGTASYFYHSDLLLPESTVWFLPEHFQTDEPPRPLVSVP